MFTDYSIFLLFSFHIGLLYVKSWAFLTLFYVFIFKEVPIDKKYIISSRRFQITLVLFSFLMMSLELNFLLTFFIEADLYSYEYLSIIDQIFFTTLSVIYIVKEVKENGKK